jgi:beta-1,4-mannosyl-glycoprotein beta-1,4-N-acetylglucosaminyltransferase
MKKDKIIDCITFFDNNYMFDLRFNILKDYVDYFVICESKYDHRNIKKKLNFNHELIKHKKIKYVVMEMPFPKNTNLWENQAIQREFLLKKTSFADPEDFIFFSDPDEIPNPQIIKNFKLKNKYGIFFQKCFNYKLNLYNPHESPWEGTRVCKMKNLKSIDYMRQKIRSKNIDYSFYRIDKEKNIEIFYDGGWHFNNIMKPEDISLKLKTFAHSEFSGERYSNVELIKKKIEDKVDLFERGHKYQKVDINHSFPEYIMSNHEKYKLYIL